MTMAENQNVIYLPREIWEAAAHLKDSENSERYCFLLLHKRGKACQPVSVRLLMDSIGSLDRMILEEDGRPLEKLEDLRRNIIKLTAKAGV